MRQGMARRDERGHGERRQEWVWKNKRVQQERAWREKARGHGERGCSEIREGTVRQEGMVRWDSEIVSEGMTREGKGALTRHVCCLF